MAGTVEKKLAELGITLPTPTAPVANYVPFVRTGNVLVISGQICFDNDGKLVAKGKLGGGVSIEDGAKAAKASAILLLAQLKAALAGHGLKEINPAGQAFDPHQHEAISHQPDAKVPEEHVLHVVRTGFSLNGRLLRPASVVVSSGPAKPAAS